ncbi:MAG: UDP-3-O-(3-hydroxymyristoyl)glucosamine N-acyltransferase [Lautropia sp.]|nr:UDP-3-O-(3-hydroxymyristoyl)glucosamine N-acyltransferase [Lautropia sp.]
MKRLLETPVSLGELARVLGATLRGDPAVMVRRLASLRSADPESISFLVRPQQREAALGSQAAAFIVSPELADGLPPEANLLLDPKPYLAYARLAQWFDARVNPRPPAGIAKGAHVHPDAEVSPEAIVEAGAVIGARSRIAAGAWIGANAVIGAGCAVGRNSRLHAQVVLGDDCVVGENTLIHAGAIIGADGFGFAPKQGGGWSKIPQLGAVVIGDEVEIGACTCIDRGALDDTVIEDGCKIDNLVQIAHNVRVGADTAIAACAGVAGSAVIGKGCQIGGASGINGHITVADGTVVSTMTLISRSVAKPGFYSGIFPSMDNAQWERAAAVVRQLPDMRKRLRRLEQALPLATDSAES